MESERIMDAMEQGIVKAIHNGDLFKIPYDQKIDVSKEMRRAYEKIDYARLEIKIIEALEEELARKIVNKVVTEMGTDIKKLMCNPNIRDDFRFMLRKGVEDILGRVTTNGNVSR